MAGSKGVVEQIIEVLTNLFNFSKPTDGAAGWARFCIKCMVAFTLFMFVLEMFLNALGMGGEMISPITGGIQTLISNLIESEAATAPQG
jgi:hypothetical protein